MTASYLDAQLERLLRSRFVEDESVVNKLFEPAGPLGSFSAKMDFAFLWLYLIVSHTGNCTLFGAYEMNSVTDTKP